MINVNLKSGTNQLHGSALRDSAEQATWTRIPGRTIWRARRAGRSSRISSADGRRSRSSRTSCSSSAIIRARASHHRAGGRGPRPFGIHADSDRGDEERRLLQPARAGRHRYRRRQRAVTYQKGAIYDPQSTVYQHRRTCSARSRGRRSRATSSPRAAGIPLSPRSCQLYPTTNQPIITGNAPARDFYYISPGGQVTDQGDGRVDYRLSDKDSLFGSLSWSNTGKTSGSPFPGPLDGADFNGAQETDLSRNAQISYTRVWSPDADFGNPRRLHPAGDFAARRESRAPTCSRSSASAATIRPRRPRTTADCRRSPSPAVIKQTGANDWIPTKEFNNVWDFIQNVAISKGSHSLKFGAEFRPIKFPFFQVPDPARQYRLQRAIRPLPVDAKSTGPTSARPATRSPPRCSARSTAATSRPPTSSLRRRVAWAVYAQDDWKVTPKLTLNLGLRYELWSPIDERFGRQANFDLQTLTLYIPKGTQSGCCRCLRTSRRRSQRSRFARPGAQHSDSVG